MFCNAETRFLSDIPPVNLLLFDYLLYVKHE